MDKGNEYYRRFLQGEKEAFSELVATYNDRLILFLFGIVKDFATAEDIAADTFLHLLIKKPSFKQEAAFKTWLFRIARNRAIDYLRKKKKYPEISLEDASGTPASIKEQAESFLLHNEEKAKLYAALTSLPPHYQNVLQLLYFEELSYKQIAAILQMNEKQVKNIAYRARKAAKDAFEKEEIENAVK